MCVSLSEMKLTVDSQTNTWNDHVNFRSPDLGMLIEPWNLTAEFPQHQTRRAFFIMMCHIHDLQFNFFDCTVV